MKFLFFAKKEGFILAHTLVYFILFLNLSSYLISSYYYQYQQKQSLNKIHTWLAIEKKIITDLWQKNLDNFTWNDYQITIDHYNEQELLATIQGLNQQIRLQLSYDLEKKQLFEYTYK